MKNLLKLITIILFVSNILISQTPEEISASFEQYSLDYNIPTDLLKAVAYTETRFYHVVPDESHKSCSGIPHSYGIMGLRNDTWFGSSLTDAAELINATPDLLIQNYDLNIKGAAALLSHYANRTKINRNDLNDWKTILEKYSGIPQEDVKEFYSFDVFKVLYEGANTNGIQIAPHIEINMEQFGENVNPSDKLKNIESLDYGPAVWDPSLPTILQIVSVSFFR